MSDSGTTTSKPPLLSFFIPALAGGGAERVVLDLAAYYSSCGYTIDLLLAKANGPYLKRVPSNVNLIDFQVWPTSLTLPYVVQYLSKNRPVALLSCLSECNLIALIAKQISKSTTRIIIREGNANSRLLSKDTSFKLRFKTWLRRYIYPKANGIIAVSNGVAHDLSESALLSRETITTIYNPVVTDTSIALSNVPVTHSWFNVPDIPIVLAAGRLIPQKDFTTLIRAFAILCQRMSARLCILGEGPEKVHLQNLTRQLSISDKVTFLGFVDNPFNLMKNANLFVLSSVWEGLPNVLIQAMSCGTPVVSTDCPYGPREILQDGLYGPLVAVGDSSLLSEAMYEVLNTPTESTKLISRALDFHIKVIADRYLELLLDTN